MHCGKNTPFLGHLSQVTLLIASKCCFTKWRCKFTNKFPVEKSAFQMDFGLFTSPVHGWRKSSNGFYIPETPTLAVQVVCQILAVCIFCTLEFQIHLLLILSSRFPQYPAAGWTEFTAFAYQPRKKLSRRV